MPILPDNPTDQQRDQAIQAILNRVGGNAGAALAITQALPAKLKNEMYDFARRRSVDDELEAVNAIGRRVTISKLVFTRNQPTECTGPIDVDPNGAWKVQAVANGMVRLIPVAGSVYFDVPYSQITDITQP